MNKEGWLALAAVLVVIIALAIFMVQRGPAEEPSELQVSNFQFSEYEIPAGSGLPVPVELIIRQTASVGGGSVAFEGPVQKPTPCHTLSASSRVDGNDIIVDITAEAGEGFCIQVIADVFYRGSFEYTGTFDELIVNYQGQEIGRA